MKERIFISGSQMFNTCERFVNAPLFRREFSCDCERARLEIVCVGFYRLFLNGRELTKAYLTPYLSNPDHLVYRDEYLVEGLLPAGNVLCVLLGNGFSDVNDNNLWDFEKASFRAAPKFALELWVGDKMLLCADEHFSVCDSPILFDDLRCGERYDARLEREDVFLPACKGGFRRAIRVAPPKGEERVSMAAPVAAFQRLSVKRILKCPQKKAWIYDFGEVNAGVCELKIEGKAGQTVHLYHGEVLSDGMLDLGNISFGDRSPQDFVQHDVYICRGGKGTYRPSFTYHGFRYVQVEGIEEEQATEDLLTFLVVHSDLALRGRFSCGDPVLDGVQACTVRSDLSNFHFFPTDCPQREKNGWTADAALSAEQLLYNFDAAASLREWLFQIRKAQTAEGMLPGIIPTSGWGYTWGNGPAWDSVLVELPYEIYRFTGDRGVIEENAEAISRYFSYLSSRRNAEGLLAIGLGDWCEAGTFSEDGYATPLEITDSLVTLRLLKRSRELFGVIGRDDGALASLEAELSAAFLKKYDPHCEAIGTQTGLALAVSMGIFGEEGTRTAYDRLCALLRREGHFRVGVIGAKFLFDVLSSRGDAELAYRLITVKTFPSYAYNLDRGATTLWEAFQEFEDRTDRVVRKDGGERILSFNHHFWGSVSAWFYRAVAGLDVRGAGTVTLSPCIIPQLAYAEAEYRSGASFIRTRWERRGNGIFLRVENRGFCVRLAFRNGECAPEGVSEYEISRV